MSKAKHMECPGCGQEISSDDFVFDEEGGTGICPRCENDVMWPDDDMPDHVEAYRAGRTPHLD